MVTTLRSEEVIGTCQQECVVAFSPFAVAGSGTLPLTPLGGGPGLGAIIPLVIAKPSTDASGPDTIATNDIQPAIDRDLPEMMDDLLALSMASFDFWDSEGDDIYNDL